MWADIKMKKNKKLIHPWSCQTEDKITKKRIEMEILFHSEVNEIVSEIKNCVCQYDRVMDIDVKNFPDFHSQMQAAEEKKIKGNELKRRINKRLKSIGTLCEKHRIPLNICVSYPEICYKATSRVAPAFIYYSLKRECLVVIDHTFEEWADPDGFFKDFDSGYLTKDFYVDPNLGVGTIKIEDGIVRIGNFETEYDIPDVVWEYITYLHAVLDLNDIKVPTENI